MPADTPGLQPGDYDAAVRIAGSGINNSSQQAMSTLTVTGTASAEIRASRYDPDNNQTISRAEALPAFGDYFSRSIGLEELLTAVGLRWLIPRLTVGLLAEPAPPGRGVQAPAGC